jgi:hypothetical protein
MEEVRCTFYQLLPNFGATSSEPFLTLVNSSLILLELASAPASKPRRPITAPALLILLLQLPCAPPLSPLLSGR